MSTLAMNEHEMPLAADDFNALEQRVLRMVSLLQTEREARAAAERHTAELQHRLDEQNSSAKHTQTELDALRQERESVRQRVERLLKQLDDITA
jgi:hypothetical protein